MSGLRERMNRLRGRSGDSTGTEADTATAEGLSGQTAESLPDQVAEADRWSPVWTRMNVRAAMNEWGSYLLRETVYPLDYYHGYHRLSELKEAARPLRAFHPSSSPEPDAYNLLFLDLETTGLGVGTGNVPFMVGLAFVRGDQFVVEQYLIRHPAEERAMLARLSERLNNSSYLVTYNGKTFDWPVLAGRYIMNGFKRNQPNLLHLDFLHPSRSIWRNTLTSCRLSHVEEERLGIHREDDVPGSLAPSIYFQFLSDGDPAPLEGVFRHNEIDMLSLAGLAVRFGRLLDGGLGRDVPYPEQPEELLRTGLWLEKLKGPGAAEPLFERLAARDRIESGWSLPLAARDKKVGNWKRAVLLWQKIVVEAESSFWPSYDAHIELAMYYEHRMKDAESALRYAETALRLALKRPADRQTPLKRRAELEAIRGRIERLKRKTTKNSDRGQISAF
ncbi:ribonuclease H-like domain-containing protein [Paenibacillus tarimensis]